MIQGYIVESRMGATTFKNKGLRFDRLGAMKSLIDGLLLTMDEVTVRAGSVTVSGTSYQDIYERLDRSSADLDGFLDGARWW